MILVMTARSPVTFLPIGKHWNWVTKLQRRIIVVLSICIFPIRPYRVCSHDSCGIRGRDLSGYPRISEFLYRRFSLLFWTRIRSISIGLIRVCGIRCDFCVKIVTNHSFPRQKKHGKNKKTTWEQTLRGFSRGGFFCIKSVLKRNKLMKSTQK